LTVTAHPTPQSFSHSATEEFTRRPADSKHEPLVVELHAIGFNPMFQMQDLSLGPHNRPLIDQLRPIRVSTRQRTFEAKEPDKISATGASPGPIARPSQFAQGQ